VRVDSASTRSVLGDALGSTVSLADSGGTVQTEYTYEPFGVATVSGVSSGNELRYTGREDDGTALDYYRARYYHPTLQRFLSEDPIGFAGGDVNLYAYVGNDPFNYRDPLGLDKKPAQSCGGSLPMAPPGADVNTNIRDAARQYNPAWFFRQVRNKGPWDYKQQGKGREIGGNYNPYEAFGNFNYGATAAAFGFPDQVVLRLAGFAQWRAGTSLPEYGSPFGLFPPYGDDPLDQHWIQAGINYHRCTYSLVGNDPGVPAFYAFP
jgi:type VI secretion system secreted protein VgrG